ncbi:MAG TPA: MerR family transcriptional regulator [Rubrivivax sp.]|nr:chaperone modulator CbpM [Burkholderiales bacterium]HNT39527.1 MerR family transcriptional regulator [Rubrivivax sp.]
MIRPTPTTQHVEAMLDDLWLDMDALCRAAGVDAGWVRARTAEGLLPAPPLGARDECRFDATLLRRVRRMSRLERDFDAVPELAALVADMETEIERLRRRLEALAGLGWDEPR